MQKEYKLITIRPCGRSGSIFLQSLFDSHPQILSFPMVFPFYLHWRIYTEIKKERSIESLVTYFVTKTDLKYLFGTYTPETYMCIDKSGEKFGFKINKGVFIKNIKEIIKKYKTTFPTRREFLIALHVAYAKTIKVPLKNKKIIVLHEHTSYNYEDANNDFPELLNIVTVREPRNSYASFVKYRLKLGGIFSAFYIIVDLNTWVNGFVNAFVYAKKYPKMIYFLRTEDLNSDPKKEMEKLIRIIGIQFKSSLLNSTYAGYARNWGFSTFTKKKSNFDPKGMKSDRWGNVCSGREMKIIDVLFKQENIRFNYNKSLQEEPLYKTIVTILKPDLSLLRLRYNTPKDIFLYIMSLNPVWTRICFLRNLFFVRNTDKGKYIELPLYNIMFFDILLNKLKIKQIFRISL